jgi:hypothetical protein
MRSGRRFRSAPDPASANNPARRRVRTESRDAGVLEAPKFIKSTRNGRQGFYGFRAYTARMGFLALERGSRRLSRTFLSPGATASSLDLAAQKIPNLIGTRQETENAVISLRMRWLTFSNRYRFVDLNCLIFNPFFLPIFARRRCQGCVPFQIFGGSARKLSAQHRLMHCACVT